jgi:PAS fold
MEATSNEEVLGMNRAQLWPAEKRAEIMEALCRAAKGENATIRGRCPTLKGSDRCWETHFCAVQTRLLPDLTLFGITREISATLSYGAAQVALT